MPENLVVGAGFSGAVIAERLAAVHNETVLIIDNKDHIGGNSCDYIDENSIHIHKYGSHIFHTNNESVWNYVNKFTAFNTYMHKVFASIDGIESTIPFNITTLYNVLPNSIAKKIETKLLRNFEYNSKIPILELQKIRDKDLNFFADYVYKKVFLNYTIKQWGASPKDIDSSLTARVPVLISKDSRYFQDKYQGIPLEGYSKMIEKMLASKNIEVQLNTDYSDVKNRKFRRIFFTGSIDEFFNYKFGILPYRSVNFKFETHNREFYQQNSVVNYPNNYDFTRIHEYKHYLNDKSEKTVIAKEYSEDFIPEKNSRNYPVPSEQNLAVYKKYLKEASRLDNIYFLGRLGDYKYYDMDKAILRALTLFDEIRKTTKSEVKELIN